jgi:acyl-CoA thioester hydrolase
MEEARIDFMDQMGFPYARMEAEGIISPVRSVSCQYKRPCTFGDVLNITVAVDGFNGVVLTLRYDMTNAASGELVCQARSEHVFMRRGGSILRMKRDMPEFTAAIEGMCPKP